MYHLKTNDNEDEDKDKDDDNIIAKNTKTKEKARAICTLIGWIDCTLCFQLLNLHSYL